MKILFISSENMIGADVARFLHLEGHEVKLFIDDKNRKANFENIIKKTTDWKKELKWVGKNGLIIFDDVGYGSIQDKLRKDGYIVFGGSRLADKLEINRAYGQKIMKNCGLQALETYDFNDIDECIAFIKHSKKQWVLKQNDHKLSINTVSQFSNNKDILDVLELCKTEYHDKVKIVTLQEKVEGVEIGVGRYFNGKDWVGPIEINFEHKRLFDGDIGPLTGEMGTLAWFDGNEKNVLFQRTIAKMKDYLAKIDFRGDFEINFIVSGDNIYPLEVTPRMGSPIVHLQSEFIDCRWAEFLKAIASGKSFNLKWQKGYGIVVLLAVPPFPYVYNSKQNSPIGSSIYFKNINNVDQRHIFFEGVAKKYIIGKEEFFVSDKDGCVLYVAGVGKTVEKARKKVYNIINKIYIPKSFYRSDIGIKFLEKDRELLKKWGYLK